MNNIHHYYYNYIYMESFDKSCLCNIKDLFLYLSIYRFIYTYNKNLIASLYSYRFNLKNSFNTSLKLNYIIN